MVEWIQGGSQIAIKTNRRSQLTIEQTACQITPKHTHRPAYVALEDLYLIPDQWPDLDNILGQPLREISVGQLLALRLKVTATDYAAQADLALASAEWFEAALVDANPHNDGLASISRWLPVDQAHLTEQRQRLLAFKLALYLSVVLIPLCFAAGRKDRAAALTAVFLQRMRADRWSHLAIAGGAGHGPSTLSIAMLPLASLCD